MYIECSVVRNKSILFCIYERAYILLIAIVVIIYNTGGFRSLSQQCIQYFENESTLMYSRQNKIIVVNFELYSHISFRLQQKK